MKQRVKNVFFDNLFWPWPLHITWIRILPYHLHTIACGDQANFVRGCQTLTFLFVFVLVDEGRKDPNTTKSGPSSAREQNVIKWCLAGVALMGQHWMLAWQLCHFSGDPVQYRKETLYFCDFSVCVCVWGGSGPPVSPSGSPRALSINVPNMSHP